MVTLFNVISRDGFIAGKNGNEDFIPDTLWSRTLDFIGRYDTLVMGRKTYEAIQAYPRELREPFERLPMKKIVVSSNRSLKLDPRAGYILASSPRDALASGQRVLVSSGPDLNTGLLKDNLIDKVIFYQVPAIVSEGVKPFSIDTKQILMQISKQKIADGIEEIEYRVMKQV